MKKLNLKLPKVTRTVLYVTLAVLVIAGLIALGAVQSVRQNRVEARQTAVTNDSLHESKAEVTRLRSEVQALQTRAVEAEATAGSVCNWVVSLQKTYKYTVPPLCVKQ